MAWLTYIISYTIRFLQPDAMCHVDVLCPNDGGTWQLEGIPSMRASNGRRVGKSRKWRPVAGDIWRMSIQRTYTSVGRFVSDCLTSCNTYKHVIHAVVPSFGKCNVLRVVNNSLVATKLAGVAVQHYLISDTHCQVINPIPYIDKTK